MSKYLIIFYILFSALFSYAMPLENLEAPYGAETTVNLIVSTLSQDISTASYYELLSWCRELSLKETGSRKDLQARLLKYYSIKLPSTLEKKGTTIEIESAKETEYFTIDSAKENYVSLSGDVLLTIEDRGKNRKHTIKANKIVFNETKNTVTATGNVEYHLQNGTQDEVFRGESISFDLNTWEGMFYRGKTEREQEQNGKKTKYFFSGREIERKKNDIVILRDGSITSCNLENNPHYHLQAKRIWVLAPGEWAVQNSILYIGRIPVMAVPFFFYPGDKLFFHPALGYKTREGNFVQTTTYLLGRKKQVSNPISFLNLNKSGNGQYKEKIKGLFLRKHKETVNTSNEDFLKVFLDLYSRLGIFSGMEGNFHPDITFKGGIAASRDIFYDSLTNLYTPFYMNENNELVSLWNSSYFLGVAMPFRFGLKSKLNSHAGVFNFTGNFELYSDPFFSQDFYSRSEGLDWDTLLSSQSAESTFSGIRSNLLLSFGTTADLTKYIKSDFIKNISFPYINIKYSLMSKDNTGLPDNIKDVDPSRKFYYPLSLKIPEVSFNLNGNIFSSRGGYSKNSTKTKKTANSNSSGAVSKNSGSKSLKGYEFSLLPEKTKTPLKNNESTNQFGSETKIKPPSRITNMPAAITSKIPNISVNYQLRPKFLVEDTFNSENWNTAEDIDYSLLYTTLTGSGFSRIDGLFDFFNSSLKLSDGLVLEGNYINHINRANSISDEDWLNLQLNDYNQIGFDMKNIASIAVFPFTAVDVLKGTAFTYNLNWLFYRLIFSDNSNGLPVYTGIPPEWNKDSVLANNLSFLFKYSPFDTVAEAVTFTYSMPPMQQTITAKIDSKLMFSTTSVQSAVRETETNSWIFDPISINENLLFGKELSLTASAKYNTEDSVFNTITTGLKLWNFNSSLYFERMVPLDPLGNPEGGKEYFMPLLLKAGYRIPGGNYYFWKNRINLESSVNADFSMNLQKYIDSTFNFTLKFNVSIYNFLDLSFSSTSYNNRIYLYIPGMAEKLDEKWVNPLSDLFRSFNFFNIKDRYRTFFKIKSLSIKGVHHLHDWDLTFEYTGKPELRQYADGTAQYEWAPSFSVFIKWPSFPLMKTKISGDSNGINIRG